jgi:hypothetical protein
MKNLFKVTFLFCVLAHSNLCAQNEVVSNDSVPKSKESKFEFNLDIFNRYLWRGQCWGGDYTVVQPTITYAATDKITVGFWATSNFKSDYFYPDGETSYKGYQEIDFNINYQATPFLSVQLWDYYWPSVSKVEGVDNDFFNYGKDSVKTVDAMLVFDFSEYEFPLYATLSTLVAGNDFRYDANGENPKQNFTTYFEAGYTWEELYQKITLDVLAGVVFNNQAAYYTYTDYDKPSLTNMSIKTEREFKLSERMVMPVSLNYIHNAGKENTEAFGRNFLVAGISFNYK